MTTRVDIDAHAGWDVKVIHEDLVDGEWKKSGETVVPANTKFSSAVWDNRRIIVEELRKPAG